VIYNGGWFAPVGRCANIIFRIARILTVLTEEHDRRTMQHAPLLTLASLLFVTLLFAGCASAANLQSMAPAAQSSAAAPAGLEEVVLPLSDYVVMASPLATPTPTPTADEKQYVTVVAQPRANLRSGPGTNFAIVAKVNTGGSLEVLGQSENNLWYKVAPPAGATGDEAWISADLTRTGGSAANVPVLAAGEALLRCEAVQRRRGRAGYARGGGRLPARRAPGDVGGRVFQHGHLDV
jgi:SH3-like domain-containing protein